jgi:hypothetical protein
VSIPVTPSGRSEGELPAFDPSVPNEGRMYDYYLGGKDNYAADREAARAALQLAPELRAIAWENRAFLARVVRYLTGTAGIRQFIDIGPGLPTRGNVHQVAQQAAPDSRVVYIDNDPVAYAHGQALLATDPHTTMIQADMRDADLIAAHPKLRDLIDLSRPTALLMFLVLHAIPEDDQAARVVQRLGALLPSGSYLAISHPVSDLCPEVTARMAHLYQQQTGAISGTPRPNVRTKDEIASLFTGWDLVEPGLTYLPYWRPVEPPSPNADSIWAVGALARKP